MLNNLSEYVRNISTFLLLITFIGIIIPNNKYKNYINLVTGFILIFIMISPISVFLLKGKYKIEDVFNEMELNMDKNIVSKEYKFYENKKRSMIVENYKEKLSKQIISIGKNKNFEVLNLNLKINENKDNFGEILEINMVVKDIKKINIKKDTSISIIKVEKVSNKNKTMNNEELENNKEVKILKNYISDFYNLSSDNIHIKVEDKNL